MPFHVLHGLRVAAMYSGDDNDRRAAFIAFEIGATDDDVVRLERRMLFGDVSAVATVERLALTRICVFPFVADCCSETWLADVVGLDALLGSEIVEVVAIDLPEGHLTDPSRTRQDEDRVMGWEFRTAKGVCTIAVRNSSNGYYGGSVEDGQWCSDPPTDATKITEDYSG